MTFPELLEWQWRDYADRHRRRANLLIHIVAVPVVWWACMQALGALILLLLGVPGALRMLSWAALLVGLSLWAQRRGNALEASPPEPFAGPADAARRLAAEQFVTFPRFVLTGGWLRNLTSAT